MTMALFDEDGNPIGEGEGFPTIPTQPPREVHLSIKDKDEENFTSVDADGNLQVKVTSMPPIEIDTTGLEINVTVANQVEVTNAEGDPIPVSGTVDVGNFPETQAVSIADVVEVSFAEVPTVTISNPVTEVSVSNFPEPVTDVTVSNGVEVTNFPEPITSIEVSNFPEPVTDVTVSSGVEVTNFPEPITSIEVSNFPSPQESIEVSNFPTSFDVTVSNPTTEVTVSNFPTEIAVNNHPTTIEVSNFPEPVTEVTVSNFPTTIEVSNQPTTIEVSNFPAAVTEVSVSNMLEANDIVLADKNYIDTQYTIFSDNTSFYADAMPPTVDPYGRDGMHYLNNYAVGATTAEKKINWYYYDPSRITARYNEYQNTWALVTMDKAPRNPYFVINTGSSLTALPTSTYVWAVPSITTQVSTTYLFWTGIEEPPATLYPDVPRVQLTLTTSGGTRVATEYILAISLHTASGEESSSVELQVYKLGYKVLNKNYDVKLEMKTANTGEVTITNTTPIPVSGTVDANVTFPESQTIDGTVLIDDSTPVDVNITNTLTIEPPENQDVTITNASVNVTIDNPTTTVSVDELPAIAITNTGFDVTNSPTVQLNTGYVDNNQKPTLNIKNPTNDVGAIVPLLVSGAIAFDGTQNVNVTNTGFNATILNEQLEVKNDIGNPLSVYFPNEPTVKINSTNAVKVDGSGFTQPVSGTLEITNDVGNAIPITAPIALNVVPKGYDGSIYHDLKTDNAGRLIVKINDAENTLVVSGAVEISNDVGNAIPVSGTVEITNDAGTPISVSGEVSIGTMPNVTIANPQTTVGVTSLPAITIQNTGFNVNNSPTVKIDGTDNTVKIAASQSVGINGTANVSFNSVSQPVNLTVNPTITNTEFGITSTQNSVKLTDGTNTASVTATNALKTTISEGVGTLSTTPMFITIVGAIDGGNWNTP
jgi:hypothetical protein